MEPFRTKEQSRGINQTPWHVNVVAPSLHIFLENPTRISQRSSFQSAYAFPLFHVRLSFLKGTIDFLIKKIDEALKRGSKDI